MGRWWLSKILKRFVRRLAMSLSLGLSLTPKTWVDRTQSKFLQLIHYKFGQYLMPGWAEPRPSEAERLESLRLSSSPLFSLTSDSCNERSPFGMIFERKVCNSPSVRRSPWLQTVAGQFGFGRYGMSTVPDDVRWFTLIQGPSSFETEPILSARIIHRHLCQPLRSGC